MTQISDTIQKEILQELHDNARFIPQITSLLQKIMLLQSKDELVADAVWYEALNILGTIRNRELITHEQQQLLRETTVAFFGMSVGSHAAITWIMESHATHIKLADPDTISASNLNRLRFGWNTIGRYKVDVVSDTLTSIEPNIAIMSSKDTTEPMAILVNNSPKTDIIVDAIDDLKGKIALRLLAKEQKIPLIQATDVGDNIFVDIERYDTDDTLIPFLNRVPNILNLSIDTLSPLERKKLIMQLVGFEENSEAMLDSLATIGKTISTWPQLGATATISGGVIATLLKKIILGENVQSGRYYISLDSMFVHDYHSATRIEQRKNKISLLTNS